MRWVVVDTHVLVWYLVRPARLAKSARRVLAQVDRGRAQAWVPGIVAAELEATLGRNPGLRLSSIDLEQIREFALLGALRDPFDRLLVAAARAVKAPLVTADGAIGASGLVEVIWD
jgi:PIN domain nuclease of toxin-antitoxin system